MSNVQRRSIGIWQSGTADERAAAAHALGVLLRRKPDADRAADARDIRKETFRRGGHVAADLAWVPALAESWPNPAGTAIAAGRRRGDWQPAGKTADVGRRRLALARHLYGEYPTPAFLDSMWLRDEAATRPDRAVRVPAGAAPPAAAPYQWASLWKAYAAGVSPYRSCMSPLGILSRRETPYLMQVPQWCGAAQAFWWVRVLAMGSPRAMADRIARSRLVDYAGQPCAAPDPRWLAVARFIAGRPPGDTLGPGELDEVLDWVRAMLRDSPEWTIDGRTTLTVRRATRDWHTLQSRQRLWERENWTGYPIDAWSWQAGAHGGQDTAVWTVSQIVTGKALAAEGHVQRHCVTSYLDRCLRGDCAILSLAVAERPFLPPRRALTVEVNRSWQIVQAKGFANRQPTGTERQVLMRWAEANGIAWLRS